jgi:hypothetical protein
MYNKRSLMKTDNKYCVRARSGWTSKKELLKKNFKKKLRIGLRWEHFVNLSFGPDRAEKKCPVQISSIYIYVYAEVELGGGRQGFISGLNILEGVFFVIINN